MSDAMRHKWTAKHGGMTGAPCAVAHRGAIGSSPKASELRRLKDLEVENDERLSRRRRRGVARWRDAGNSEETLAKAKPTQNACIESFNGRYREECLNQHWVTSIGDAYELIEDHGIDHNTERPHDPPEISNAGGIRDREALRQDAMRAAA